MLDPDNRTIAEPIDATPMLLVLVDTEEEFDWSTPLARANTATTATGAQHRAHRIFEKYGIRPTYVIDYPVAATREASAPLYELYADGRCEIGAHLHPWVNPPHEEAVNNFNSYPGNLPAALEREKLMRLTGAIEDRFGFRPTVYKAGRYGVGPATAAILEDLGYRIDTSVLARTDLGPVEGPDFTGCPARPYWFGSGRGLLEIPMSVGFAGTLADRADVLHARLTSPLGMRMHLPGILARLRLLERITLTPEGISHDEQRRLTHALLETGHRVFSFTYHSPSLAVGHTPYVRTEAELAVFLDNLDRYFDFFINEIGGRPATPPEILARLRRPGDEGAAQTMAAVRKAG